MRIRTIKPDFWKHETMCRQPAEVRLLALALLNYADDEGYFQAHPALIRGELMPFEESTRKIPKLLEALQAIGYLTLECAADGREIGHITNFLKHQRIDKPKRSKITRGVQDSSTTHPRLIHDSSKEEWEGEQGTGKRNGNGKAADAASAHAPPESTSDEFQAPAKKEGRGGAPLHLAEALAYAAAYSKGNTEMLVIEDAWVRQWFDDRNACGWEPVRSGVQVPIADWRSDLRKWCREDMRRNHGFRAPTPKKAPAAVVEVEPDGWWEAWGLLWPDVECPANWHGLAESYKTELRIKLEELKQ
jgi:hypothetical protein